MKDRALVLGGGGVAGIAWMTGLLFGLSERGVDLRTAEITVGTSAGSALAAQLASSLTLKDLFDRQVEPAKQTRELTPNVRLLESLERALLTLNGSLDQAEQTRQIGQWALEAQTVTEEERRSVIAERLPNHAWPNGALLIVAVDARNRRDQNIRSLLRNKSCRCGRCQLRRTRHMASGHDRWKALHGWRRTFVG